ncbi:hypothetical protein [Micromonospora sp. NPDC005220]
MIAALALPLLRDRALRVPTQECIPPYVDNRSRMIGAIFSLHLR